MIMDHKKMFCLPLRASVWSSWDNKMVYYYLIFDTDFSHIPQRRIKSISISGRGQIRCVLMKDLDKSECVRPALSSHTGTARLNGTEVLSEESKELPEVHLSLIAGF